MGSIGLNHDYTAATFTQAAKATVRAWRKKHGYHVPCPGMSHALSIPNEDGWTMLDAELGEVVSVVVNGMAVLAEDLPSEEAVEPQETSTESVPDETEATIPMHRYYPKKERPEQAKSKATVTTNRREK